MPVLPLVGVLADAVGPRALTPREQPRSFARGATGLLSISCLRGDVERLDLSGQRLVLTIDDGAGSVLSSIGATLVAAPTGLAGFSYGPQHTDLSRSSDVPARFDVCLLDDRGALGPTGALYQLVPASEWGLVG